MLSTVDPSAAPTVCDPQMILSFPKIPAPMPLALHYHIVIHLETGGRIDEQWRKFFYKYVAGCVKAMGCELEAIGGSGDHVHLLLGLESTQAPADIVRRIKLLSQSWVKRKMLCRNFHWQEDYQAFTVSLSQRSRIRRHILNQREHNHRAARKDENSTSSWDCVSHSGVCA